MYRKLFFLISFVLLLCLVNGALAATWTDGDPNDHLWSTPGNWDAGTVPLETGEGEGVLLEYLGPGKEGPLINEGTTANAERLQGPGYEMPPGSDLTMTGGSLTFNRYWRVGYGGAAGIVNMSGGTIINNCNYSIYMNAGSVFNLSGGTVNAGFYIPSGYSYGPDVSTLNMTGGTVDGNAPPYDSGRIRISTEGKGPGLVNLHGGTIITPRLDMDVNGLMDITEGIMIIDGDVEATITEYVGNGWLTAYGGAGMIVCSYDDVNDVTFVTALSSTPFAYGPSPADRAEDVSPDAVLKWTPGEFAASHDVYFGTDLREEFVLLDDDFEAGVDANWTSVGWVQYDANSHSGIYSASATGGGLKTFTSDDLDASQAGSLDVDFWFLKTAGVGDGEIELYYYDGNDYDLIADLNSIGPNDVWLHYTDTITDSNYFVSKFRVQFSANISSGSDAVFVDDVTVVNTWPLDPKWLVSERRDANTYDPNGLFGPLLDWGTTYYWRIDEVNDACDPNGWKGRVWTFTVHNGKAHGPDPRDGAWRVAKGTYLSWTKGPLPCQHDVYLGTDFNDVNDANTSSSEHKTRIISYSLTTYDPGGLEPGTTYYWRIDEVYSATPLVKGDVWTFRTVGLGQTLLLCDISEGEFTLKEGWTLISDANAQSDGAGLTWPDVNGTGIDVTIDTGVGDDPAFRTRLGEPLGMDYVFADDRSGSPDADIIISLSNLIPGDYILTTFHNNTAGEPKDINDVIISGGVTYSRVITSLPAPQTRSGVDNALGSIEVEFTPTGSEDVTIRYMASIAGSVVLNGFILDFFPPDTRFAYWPNPRDFAQDVDPGVVLHWSPGDWAADSNGHEVYFGTSWADVNDANNTWAIGTSVYKGPQDRDANTYDPSFILDLDRTYYWRVDEVNDACDPNGWPGRIWRFSTAEYIIIDDMEKYDEIWDGWWYGVDTWSNSDLSLWTADPVRGKQTMKFTYDNSIPFEQWYFSEAQTKDLDPNVWVGIGVKILSLWFYGESDNATTGVEPMYVYVEDNSCNPAMVKYGDRQGEHPDDIAIEEWQQWAIPISSLNDANLADLCFLAMGFGEERFYPFEGGWGEVYFDDIRLYPGLCIPEEGPDGDVTGDCYVNLKDVEVMAQEWLESDVNLGTVEPPNDANLVGYWKLDGDPCDNSGRDHHGTLEGDYEWTVGYDDVNLAIDFDNGRVRVADHPDLRPMHQVSASAWINFSGEQDSGRIVVKGPDNRETFCLEVNGDDELTFYVREDANGESYPKYNVNNNDLEQDEWVHVAGTFDGNTVKCYINGELKDTLDDPNAWGMTLSQDTNDLAIGNRSDSDEKPFEGVIDDVRVYNYGLSPEEVAHIATDGEGVFAVQSVANLYNDEDPGDRAVNLRDFAVLANDWLEKKLWPE